MSSSSDPIESLSDSEMVESFGSDDENHSIQSDDDDDDEHSSKRHKSSHHSDSDQMADSDDDDDDDSDDDDINLENLYYQAKSDWQDSGDVEEALDSFQIIIDLDGLTPSVWGFRALKQSLKILFLRLLEGKNASGDTAADGSSLGAEKCEEQIMQLYAQLLQYARERAVTKNQTEKAINSVLDRAASASHSTNVNLQERLYDMTLQSLRDTRNDRLWFSTVLKLARLCFQTGQYARMQKLLKQLRLSCQVPVFRDKDRGKEQLQALWQSTVEKYRALREDSGNASPEEAAVSNPLPPPPPINAQSMTMLDFVNYGLNTEDPNIQEWVDDKTKGTQVLETYALEIQLYTEQRNNKKLSQIYQKCMSIRSAIPHPRIMGVIRECGGKMYMREKEWERAHEDFFEAFKSYDEAGEPRRIQCLKYLILANMLSVSKIDPLEASECRPYRDHPEMRAMIGLLHAYQQQDIVRFEHILRVNRATITDNDSFIRDHISELLVTMRTQVLLKIIRPYSRIRIPHLAQQLNIGDSEQAVVEVEQLLVNLILDRRIDAHIDQINRILIIHNRTLAAGSQHGDHQAVDKVTEGVSDGGNTDALFSGSSSRHVHCERWSNELRRLLHAIHNKL